MVEGIFSLSRRYGEDTAAPVAKDNNCRHMKHENCLMLVEIFIPGWSSAHRDCAPSGSMGQETLVLPFNYCFRETRSRTSSLLIITRPDEGFFLVPWI